MQWLTALLAFATTMLMFAIIVSTLVEMIHRIFGLRSKGLRLMLENLYSQVIAPRLEIADKLEAADAAAKASGNASKDAKSKDKTAANIFAEIIMENRALQSDSSNLQQGKISRFVRWLVDSSMMTDIPVEVFTQKLADSRIVKAADTVSEDVIKDIAQKYEAFGAEVSTYFERRARLFSVILAFAVAWMFYVHPYDLVVTYIKNPDTAQNVAAQNVKTSNDYQVLAAKLEGLKPDPAVDANNTVALRKAIDGLKAAIGDATTKNMELANLGAPVGWPETPEHMASCGWTFWMKPAVPPAKDVSKDSDDANYVRDLTQFCKFELDLGFVHHPFMLPSVANAFWLLVGGLLVGLGAPFWAQAVSSLTATRDLSRRIGDIVSPGKHAARDGTVLESFALASEGVPTSVATFQLSGKAEKARRDAVDAKKVADDAAKKAADNAAKKAAGDAGKKAAEDAAAKVASARKTAKNQPAKTTEAVVAPTAKKGRARPPK